MSFNFQFRFAEDEKEIKKLSEFLLLQPFNYAGYGSWVERARHELLSGYKSAILAFSEGVLVGDLVFQPHKQFQRVRELKNMRIHPLLRGRYFGSFMIKQAELEKRDEYDAIICDIRSDRNDVIAMLRGLGYKELLRAPIYEGQTEDVVMVKRFERTPNGFFAPIEKTLIQSAF